MAIVKTLGMMFSPSRYLRPTLYRPTAKAPASGRRIHTSMRQKMVASRWLSISGPLTSSIHRCKDPSHFHSGLNSVTRNNT